MKVWHCFFMGNILWTLTAWAALVDVTRLGILPDDGVADSQAIRLALRDHSELFFPPGKYVLDTTIYLPSESRIQGASGTATVFQLGADTVAFRVEGQHDAVLENFGIDCSAFDSSVNEAVFVYARKSPEGNPQRVQINGVRVVNRRSRAPALSFIHADDCAVRRCETVDNTRLIWAAPDGIAPGDPPMAWQVYGSGITFNQCRNPVVEFNRVYETDAHIRVMTAPPPPYYQRYFQGSAIQVVACSNALIQSNWVQHTGQGIDSNRTDGALIRGNVIDNCQSHGVKLAHFAKNQRIVGNWIRRAGAMGVALSPGNDEPSVDCTVQDNVFVATGQGMGEGWWNPTGKADYPCCIHLDCAQTAGHGSRGCVIRNNTSYDNGKLTEVVANPVVVAREADRPRGARDLTVENNRVVDGPAPAPPEISH